jgi:transcriptional regulator
VRGKVVPTWNYAVAHVRGRIQFYDDATRLRAIVGFEIAIVGLVGKLKASQNRSAEDRAGIREALKSRHGGDLEELVQAPRT